MPQTSCRGAHLPAPRSAVPPRPQPARGGAVRRLRDGATAAGALESVWAAYPWPLRAAPAGSWPLPSPAPRGRLAIAVVLGASGSVITAALGPHEVFAPSPGFFVYTVSARPAAVACLGWHLYATALMPRQRVAPSGLSYALTADFSWFRPTLGIELAHAGRRTASSASIACRAASPPTPARHRISPRAHLRLAGSPWPWRPTTLFALTIAAAIGVALSPAAAARRHRP
jgi:hypothetical protein